MGILFLPARQGRCSGLLFCSAVRPLLLLRLRPWPTPTTAMAMALVATLDTATLASGAMEDMEDMALATAVLDTPPLDTLDLDTLVVTTASVRLRPSPKLMPMLRLIPTTDTDMALDTVADTPPSDTAVATDSATEATDSAMEATAVATDSATEATLVATMASVRPRPSPRLMLRLIPTSDTATPDLGPPAGGSTKDTL